MDFNYKKYSLEKLQEWVHDALSTGEASPHEIYSAIREAVREDYYYYKDHCSRAYGLLELLSGHRPVEDKELFETAVAEREYYEGWDKWEETYYPESCDKDDPSPECKKSWTSFWEETDDGMRPWGHSDMEYLIANQKKEKVKKWGLPVEMDPSGEYFVTFPDDLLEAANLKEGDQVEWVDQGDGSYLLKKVEKKAPTYDEMVAAGYTMTDDGFWMKETIAMDDC